MEKKKDGIKDGLIWSFGERITAQIVSTVVVIILARLLDPTHYGIISIVNVFITFCNVFVTSGMGSAIVQKKEVDEEDYNTAFFISLSIAIVLYAILFVSASFIAEFYEMKELKWVLRIMALRLPIASINTIQHSHIQRSMQFKRFFIATLFGTVLSGIVGIWCAIKGLGVWSLVAQYLTNTIVDTIVLFFVEKWIPKFQFSIKKARSIFNFGWKVLITDLINTAETDICSLIVGKVFGSADLAYYDQGKRYPSILVNNINSAIYKVMLPAYSQSQDELNNLKKMLRKSISVGVFVLAPILCGFAAISDSFISLILTDKWILCSPYIKIFCFIYFTRPMETLCHQALLAIGRSDIVLRIMVAINIVSIVTCIIAVFGFNSVFLIAVGLLISTIVSLACFMLYSNKLIGYRMQEQLSDIGPTLICCIVMGIIVYIVGLLKINKAILLSIQIILGIIIYIILAQILKIEAYQYLQGMMKIHLKRKI